MDNRSIGTEILLSKYVQNGYHSTGLIDLVAHPLENAWLTGKKPLDIQIYAVIPLPAEQPFEEARRHFSHLSLNARSLVLLQELLGRIEDKIALALGFSDNHCPGINAYVDSDCGMRVTLVWQRLICKTSSLL